ncbi:MAG TPA: hypothetical protein VKY74_15920 [Chloroflexia bacterium]|nr:hypothetical protein [Chloroflexia bacterium]
MPDFAAAVHGLRSYHIYYNRFNNEGHGMPIGNPLEGDVDVIHMRASFTVTHGREIDHQIVLSETVYTQDATGLWSIGQPPLIQLAAPPIPVPQGGGNYVLDQTEDYYDGVPCHGYRFHTSFQDPKEPLNFSASSSDYFIGVADGIPRYVFQNTESEAGQSGEQLELSKINQPMVIVVPVFRLEATVTPPPTPLLTPVPSGWRFMATPEPGQLSGVVALAADNIWTVGQASPGPVLIQHWDGQTWQPIPYTGPPGTGLAAIAATGPADLWAVGRESNGRALILHSDGTTWRPMSPQLDETTGWNELYAVTALAPDDVWAVGRQGLGVGPGAPFLIHWNGRAWQEVATPVPRFPMLTAISGRAADDVWLVGRVEQDAVGQTLTLHWDGHTWQRVPSPNPGAVSNQLNAVSATAGGVWAVGEFIDNTGAGQTLILHWDGRQWRQMASPSPGVLYTVTSRSPLDAWVGGTDRQTLAEHWDGQAWRIVPSPNSSPAGNIIQSMAIAPNGDLWAVGVGGSSQQTVLAVRYQPRLGPPAASPAP